MTHRKRRYETVRAKKKKKKEKPIVLYAKPVLPIQDPLVTRAQEIAISLVEQTSRHLTDKDRHRLKRSSFALAKQERRPQPPFDPSRITRQHVIVSRILANTSQGSFCIGSLSYTKHPNCSLMFARAFVSRTRPFVWVDFTFTFRAGLIRPGYVFKKLAYLELFNMCLIHEYDRIEHFMRRILAKARRLIKFIKTDPAFKRVTHSLPVKKKIKASNSGSSLAKQGVPTERRSLVEVVEEKARVVDESTARFYRDVLKLPLELQFLFSEEIKLAKNHFDQ